MISLKKDDISLDFLTISTPVLIKKALSEIKERFFVVIKSIHPAIPIVAAIPAKSGKQQSQYKLCFYVFALFMLITGYNVHQGCFLHEFQSGDQF
ncbi:hypothetical protein NLX67_08300 [Domibacillus sp. A3M-37]|uniref:hypothetical protein n=1 Tax=Domibacillus TaxID=1433999 RepID=UPI0020B7BA9A|nr:hypothetical protein [Domibacillus sp. A3M-37]MCP3762390.1 hypothetical protein [Domibacillus sp. A3M-37]